MCDAFPVLISCLFLQWVVLTRKHAEIVVKDDVVFPIFQWHCKASSTRYWFNRWGSAHLNVGRMVN